MTKLRWTVILRDQGIDGALEERFIPLPNGVKSDEARKLMYSGLRYEQLEKSGLLQYYGISFDNQGNLVHDPSSALASFTGSHSVPMQQQPQQKVVTQRTAPVKQNMQKELPVMPTQETDAEKVDRLSSKLSSKML